MSSLPITYEGLRSQPIILNLDPKVHGVIVGTNPETGTVAVVGWKDQSGEQVPAYALVTLADENTIVYYETTCMVCMTPLLAEDETRDKQVQCDCSAGVICERCAAGYEHSASCWVHDPDRDL